jgi:hypothetical protein
MDLPLHSIRLPDRFLVHSGRSKLRVPLSRALLQHLRESIKCCSTGVAVHSLLSAIEHIHRRLVCSNI